MSSKSDQDNRSNQMNPNNSAYESSRDRGGYDDDDDYGGYTFTDRYRYEAPPEVFDDRPYSFHFVTLHGDVLGFGITARRKADRGLDCFGIAEKCGYFIYDFLQRHSGAKLAYYQALVSGQPHMALTRHYTQNHWLRGRNDAPDPHDAVWKSQSEAIAKRVRGQLEGGIALECTNLGVITEDMVTGLRPNVAAIHKAVLAVADTVRERRVQQHE